MGYIRYSLYGALYRWPYIYNYICIESISRQIIRKKIIKALMCNCTHWREKRDETMSARTGRPRWPMMVTLGLHGTWLRRPLSGILPTWPTYKIQYIIAKYLFLCVFSSPPFKWLLWRPKPLKRCVRSIICKVTLFVILLARSHKKIIEYVVHIGYIFFTIFLFFSLSLFHTRTHTQLCYYVHSMITPFLLI